MEGPQDHFVYTSSVDVQKQRAEGEVISAVMDALFTLLYIKIYPTQMMYNFIENKQKSMIKSKIKYPLTNNEQQFNYF